MFYFTFIHTELSGLFMIQILNSKPATIPKTKPPICAHHAVPPDEEAAGPNELTPLNNCIIIQKPNAIKAGM